MTIFDLLDHDLMLTETITEPLQASHQRISRLEQRLKRQLSPEQWESYVDVSDATLDHHLDVNKQYFDAGLRYGMALVLFLALAKAKS